MKRVAVGIIMQHGKVLACQRKRDARYALKWEFPGGKIEPGETPEQALVRELNEELGISALIGKELLRQDWVYPEGTDHPERDGSFSVSYLHVLSFSGEPVNRAFEQILWVSPSGLATMDILEGNRQAVDLLVQHAKEHQAA